MTPPPRLSIVIPCFNHGRYLDECLESILAQTFRDCEVLIADDGSTDDSPERIRAWSARCPDLIRPILHPVNRGVQVVLHDAFLQCRGADLTKVDADDYFIDTRKLEREMDLILAGQARNETVLAFSDIQLVRDDRAPICRNSDYAPLREGHLLAEILGRSCLIPRDFIMPRTAYFAVGGYNPDISLYEDWDLKIRLAEHYPFRYSGVIGTAYRQHGRGISSRPWSVHIEWLNKVFALHLPRAAAEDHEAIRAEFARFMADIHQRAAKKNSGGG